MLSQSAASSATPPAADRVSASRWRRAAGTRTAAHLLCWAPFAWAAVNSVRLGWVATSDNAVIALRSWSALTSHGPLVGQATRLANGLYDPGPLEYWLLAAPVHVDPARGVLWGAALWCMLACSVLIEAAFSAAGAAGALAAAGAGLGAVLWIPKIAAVPSWNPWFGMMSFLAALAAAWAVMAGRRWWWPAAVVEASVAAQAHLMFGPASAAVALVSLCAGLAATVRAKARGWWLAAGLATGLACWSAPLLQQITSRNGNLARLVSGHPSPGGTGGAAFGLKALAASAAPPPLWWHPLGPLTQLDAVGSRSAATGIAVLALTAAALAAAVFALRSRALAALAAVSVVTSAAVAATYAAIPSATLSGGASGLRYLAAPMFAVGASCWLAVGSAASLAARAALRRVRWRRAARARRGSGLPEPTAGRNARRIGAFAGTAALAAASAAAVALTSAAQGAQNPMMGAVRAASAPIERALPPQPVALTVIGPYAPDRRRLTMGLAYALAALGYRPEVTYPYWAHQLGGYYVFRRHRAIARATVSLWGPGVRVEIRGPASPAAASGPGQGRAANMATSQ